MVSNQERKTLPDARFGLGTVLKFEDGAIGISVRDDGPIAFPRRGDSQSGHHDEGEAIETGQQREGTEEAVFVRETEDGEVEVGIPRDIRDTELEYNVIRNYRKAREDEESPLPEADGVFYYNSSLGVGDGMPKFEAQEGVYTTGYTLEVTDEGLHLEMLGERDLPFTGEEIQESNLAVYDIEHGEFGGEVEHFDRPFGILYPEEDEIAVFRGGEEEYSGEVGELRSFLEEEYGWEMQDDEVLATAKIQQVLDVYGESLGDQTRREMVDKEYMEGLARVARALEEVPEP